MISNSQTVKADMRTAMVTRERELTKALTIKDYELQKREMSQQLEYKTKERGLKNSLSRIGFLTDFGLIAIVDPVVTLVLLKAIK